MYIIQSQPLIPCHSLRIRVIRTEYREIVRISPYLVRIRKPPNTGTFHAVIIKEWEYFGLYF